MKIIITGDVHHMSMKGRDQRYMVEDEFHIAMKYLDILNNLSISPTLFFTGKSVLENLEYIRQEKLGYRFSFEVGGHGWNAFKPITFYRFSKYLLGSQCGPKILQNYHVTKTLSLLRGELADSVISWRNHGYRFDRNTEKILISNGISRWSDRIIYNNLEPFYNGELLEFPINTYPDHDYIIHGDLTSNAFTSVQWIDAILSQISDLNDKNATYAMLLLHPGCMSILDNFKTMVSLCKELNGFEASPLGLY